MKEFKAKSATFSLHLKLCLALAIFTLSMSMAIAQDTVIDTAPKLNASQLDYQYVNTETTYKLSDDSSEYLYKVTGPMGAFHFTTNTAEGATTFKATPTAGNFALLHSDGNYSSINLYGNFNLEVNTDATTVRNSSNTVNGILVQNSGTFNMQSNGNGANTGALKIKMTDTNDTGTTTQHDVVGINIGAASTANISGPLSIDITRENTYGNTFGIQSSGTVNITNDVDIKIIINKTPGTQYDRFFAGINGSVDITADNLNIYVESSAPDQEFYGVRELYSSSSKFNAKNTKITAAYAEGVDGTLNLAVFLNSYSRADFNYGEHGEDLGNTVQLEGIVASINDATLNINLTNENSYIRGGISEYDTYGGGKGTINLLLTKGATWYADIWSGQGWIQYNSANATFDGGVIDLAWKENAKRNNQNLEDSFSDARVYRSIILKDAILKDTNTLVVNTDVANKTGDHFTLNNLNTDSDDESTMLVKVAYDPYIKNLIDDSEIQTLNLTFDDYQDMLKVMTIGETHGKVVTGAGEGNIVEVGLNFYTLTPDIHTNEISMQLEDEPYPQPIQTSIELLIKGLLIEKSDGGRKTTAVMVADDTISMLNWAARLQNENLQSRMGDLRINDNSRKNGIWVKTYAARQNIDSMDNENTIRQNFIGGQLGVNDMVSLGSSNLFWGGFVDYLNSENSYVTGTGDMKNFGGGLFVSMFGRKGHYFDISGRYTKIDGDFDVTDGNDNQITADFDTKSLALSAEYGYKFLNQAGWVVEPQLQYTYSKINGFDYITSNDLLFTIDDIKSQLGRLGLRIGREQANGNFYAGLDYLRDFSNKTGLHAQDMNNSQYDSVVNAETDWFKLLLGGNVATSKYSNVYCEASMLFGDSIRENWKFNLGFNFGF